MAEMSKSTNSKKARSSQAEITRITVAGYKSIQREQSIEIRPLTILAGANSSGKSSVMQPLLLLKQTLEASYDPGPLLLDGPNVKFTSTNQLFSRMGEGKQAKTFHVGIGIGHKVTLTTYYKRQTDGKLKIQRTIIIDEDRQKAFALQTRMTQEKMSILLSYLEEEKKIYDEIAKSFSSRATIKMRIVPNRGFLRLGMIVQEGTTSFQLTTAHLYAPLLPYIRHLIHLPGLRGNPERAYPVTAVGPAFPGTFENYAASVVAQWQTEKNNDKLRELGKNFERLGLTWKVTAKPINDTQVELQVGRLPRATRSGARDLVNIADVGIGISQTLPVLVALLTAEPGQLVYLEQPELHLHPRAQTAMAQVLVDAAKRGVRVVAETHSSLLLLGIQTLVAEGQLSPDIVKLHWFRRNENGATEIESADLDEAGRFGDWPEDFAEVALQTESRYLDAASVRLMKN